MKTTFLRALSCSLACAICISTSAFASSNVPTDFQQVAINSTSSSPVNVEKEFDLTNPSPQEQTITVNGEPCIIGISSAFKKSPTPRFDYDLSDNSVGEYSRTIYCNYLVMNQGFDIDYSIASDRKVTIDSVYDEYYFGISLSSDNLSIDRYNETSSRAASAHYKCSGTIDLPGSLFGISVTVNLRASFQNDELKVTVNGSKG